MKIIIVEDEVLVALSLQKDLAREGYSDVRTAGSGEKCISMFKTDPADVVLMDISLPGALDGIETARTLLQEGSPRIVFLTGYVDPSTRAAARELKHDGYFVKPILLPRLLDLLASLPKV